MVSVDVTVSLEYVVSGDQANQEGFKLNGANQLLIYAGMSIYWTKAHTLQRKLKNSLIVSKADDLEEN
jgi:hypothetical protein